MSSFHVQDFHTHKLTNSLTFPQHRHQYFRPCRDISVAVQVVEPCDLSHEKRVTVYLIAEGGKRLPLLQRDQP